MKYCKLNRNKYLFVYIKYNLKVKISYWKFCYFKISFFEGLILIII